MLITEPKINLEPRYQNINRSLVTGLCNICPMIVLHLHTESPFH